LAFCGGAARSFDDADELLAGKADTAMAYSRLRSQLEMSARDASAAAFFRMTSFPICQGAGMADAAPVPLGSRIGDRLLSRRF
jgi:hypothetical protein